MERLKAIAALTVILFPAAALAQVQVGALTTYQPPPPPPPGPASAPALSMKFAATRVVLCPPLSAAKMAEIPGHQPQGHIPLGAQVRHSPGVAAQAGAVVRNVPAEKPAPCQPPESPEDFTAGLTPLDLPPEPDTSTDQPESDSSSGESSSSSGALTSRLQYTVLNHSGQPIYCAVKWAGPRQGWSSWFTVDLEWKELSTLHSAAFECGPPVDHKLYPIVGGTKYYVVPAINGDGLEISEIAPGN
jgi:hypothetical protein